MFVLGCRCARHIFRQWQKVRCMVTAYYGQKMGENLASRTTSSVFDWFSWIWHRCLPWGVDVQDIFFDSGRKCVAMVTAYYGQKIGGNLASRTTSSVFDLFSWNSAQMFALGVDVQDTVFDSGRKCVAMVTMYYGQKMGENLASWTTSSVFDRFSWNSAQMSAFGCKCARHIFRQWQKVCCHGNGTLFRKWKKTKHLKWKLAQMLAYMYM